MTHPDGKTDLNEKDQNTIRLANRITAASFSLATHYVAKGALVSVENPAASLMWQCSAYRRFERATTPTVISVDYCMYGEPYRKRTKLAIASQNEPHPPLLFLPALTTWLSS